MIARPRRAALVLDVLGEDGFAGRPVTLWVMLTLMSPLEPISQPITRGRLKELAEAGFGEMINVRPAQGNPSRGLESSETQALIRAIVMELIQP